MPRNAAKKTSKNAKRLPVLIKLTNINLNSKKKKLYKNRKNCNTSKIKTKINCSSLIKEIRQRKNNKNNKKVVENISFTSLNRFQDNYLTSTTLPIPPHQTITTETTSTTTIVANKNLKRILKEEEANSLQNEPLESNSPKAKQTETIYKLKKFNKPELKEQLHIKFENYLQNANVACEAEQEKNSTLTSLSETGIKLSEPEPLSPASTRSLSPNPCVSSLYPIVIESFQQDYKDKEQQQGKDNDSNSKKKKIHSVNDCSSKNKNKNNNNNSSSSTNNNNTYNICTRCHTAVDTLEQHKSQNNNNNNNNKNNACNNNSSNTNNSYITTTKHSNNSYEQKQSTQSSKTTTKVLTLSKPPSSSSLSSSSSANQSQEVKARLATLRIRKKKVCLNNTTQRTQKISASTAETLESATEKDIIQGTQSKETDQTTTTTTTREAERQFIKKVSPVLDQATLNLIETLDDEVKKPNNKRKRNTAAVLLGLATLHQPRSKRITTNSLSLVDKKAPTGCAAAQDKHDQKLRTSNFIKPALSEATNTNSKKRARIMSLYERPFQAANDGRGSIVGNGYITSSRSSASSAVATATLVMNDNCDNQEMANQYYLSGASGSGSVSTSNPSLLANGSAINHAPTMGTLCNIGNTCYLNSVVYTLRFAPKFLHNLHHLLADLNALQQNIARARAKSSSLGRGISAVHMENARSWSSKDLASMEQYTSGTAINPSSSAINSTALTQVTQKTSHQVLTEKLHELYQSLHRNEINESMEPHHADTLLHAIQDVSAIFEGNQQQDAHEFLMCLLNSVRETSQTLIKAIAECPDVILNGYISNPDEIERELLKSHTSGSSGIGIGGTNSNNSNSLASASSKTSSFFSRKSKRKDESKNSKNSRLQSPLKDALVSGHNSQTTTTANSLFYLNTNDLNLMATTPASATFSAGVANTSSLTSPSNSLSSQLVGAADETDAPTSVALILKDKQRLDSKIKELGLDFFNEDFEGITVSTTKCLSCETITEQKETMIDIAVPVPQAGYESNEFTDRPSSFIQNSCITREYFRNENKYRCEQCCGYTEAIRSISYEVLPRLLIIQLSRFSGGMEKINSYIPTSFTLQCFCSKCCELSDANKLHIYKLYSVITHVGATMSVGHYIAYTCSLEWANEYINCPKEQRRRASQERNLSATGNGPGGNSAAAGGSAQSSTASSGLSTSSTGFMKMKMKFGRSKASSSGDMSKNVKQLNGLNASSKTITNGIGKLTMNNSGSSGSVTPQCPTTCQSINCCAMRLTLQQQLQYQSANNSTSDFNDESSQYSNGSSFTNQANYNNNVHHNFSTTANISGYGSTGRGATRVSYGTLQNSCSEPIWYMCDDDKIKAMTQREFEELLSPARKITITPYLLFYARYNLQSSPPKSATASTSSPGPVTSSPQTSWSNESLQSSGHSAHSSGMRM